MPDAQRGPLKNWVFWAEFVNSGSPVPAGCSWAAAGWVSATAQRPRRGRSVGFAWDGSVWGAPTARHSGLPANRKRVIPLEKFKNGHRHSGVTPSASLKKPFSISRARSSAETSTLRGVSRKTLSAIRCIPPSSA